MVTFYAIFSSTQHKKHLNPWSTSLASCVMLSAISDKMKWFKTIQALINVWQTLERTHNKIVFGNFHHQYAAAA